MSIEPNFLIIGAAKSATTSLSSLLSLHPQAGIVRTKEPHFFSYDARFEAGWDQYLQLYGHCAGKRAIGDASTSYSRIRYHPRTIGRIRRLIPNTRIIYMVRHPLERMESAYIEHLCTPGGGIFSSINDAVRCQPMIVDSSRYWEVFDAYRQAFDERHIKVVWFEDYVADTRATFADVCRFLEIDDRFEPPVDRQSLNSREDARTRMSRIDRQHIRIDTQWDAATRQQVIDLIGADNRRFLSHFGRSSDIWGGLY